MDKATLFKIHEERFARQENNDDNMEQIVQLLGGIDSILSNYLKLKDIEINTKTLKELHTIIIAPAKTLIIKSSDNEEGIGQVDNIGKIKVALNLESDNNYLHSLVKPELYNRVLVFLHHKLTMIFLLMTMILWFIFVLTQNTLLWNIYIIIVCIFFWIPYCVFWLLSVNKIAFFYILKSFDFWIKIIYMIIWGICELVYRFGVQGIEDSGIERKFYGLSFFTYALFDSVAILGLIIISSLDGFETKKTWTVIISATMSFFTIAFSVYYQFDTINNGDDSIVVLFGDYQFSLKRIMANAQRVVGIFLAKQTIALFRNTQNATSINIKPKLLWIKSRSKNQIRLQENGDGGDDGLTTTKYVNNNQLLTP